MRFSGNRDKKRRRIEDSDSDDSQSVNYSSSDDYEPSQQSIDDSIVCQSPVVSEIDDDEDDLPNENEDDFKIILTEAINKAINGHRENEAKIFEKCHDREILKSQLK